MIGVSPLVKHRGMYALFDDYINHMVPDEARSTLAPYA